MRRITRVVIAELFGHLAHDIKLRTEQPTIITGPNGVGKTNVLNLMRAALNLDVRTLHELPFHQLDIYFDDKWQLSVTRNKLTGDEIQLQICVKVAGRRRGKLFEVGEEDIESFADIPPWVERAGENRWYDGRTGSVASGRFIERRYNIKLGILPNERFSAYPEILAAIEGLRPTLIDTKRLDNIIAERPTEYGSDTYPRTSQVRIQQYIRQIRWQVEEARRASVVATQSADLSFASRALAEAGATIQEATLHNRYDKIVEQYENLSQNGLAIGEAPLEFPEKSTPTIRRILNVFLDDWEKRLEPLRPVSQKLEVLRRILDNKLVVTGKRSQVNAQGILRFMGPSSNIIRVSKLSSGEQHLVALFAMLLFSTGRTSVILIDEPEISLHAAWKHSFLDDITEVAALVNLQVILATHSSGIINGRWDLTEDLAYAPPPGQPSDLPGEQAGDSEAESEEEFE